ncbi:MAG TPA: hypothetical protein VHL31_25130 [Geminicoccus sp.]|jgi:hypothetical protein|uniref:hypothetical protein n=1 Tax=Geminicoccus sp. TaxID=2024832 RepID=UPI002E3564AC|nr:hypothetical protein [Geminicoccus sp.]HEX2529564.1 hypothetical protein [Geminicoccus sp.]
MGQTTTIRVSPADRRLQAIVAARNSAQEHVCRAKVALAAADGLGNTATGHCAGSSRPSIRRWRERFVQEGVADLRRDKTRKPGTTPPLPAVVDHVHRPFAWGADPDTIVERVRRGYERLGRMGERRAM